MQSAARILGADSHGMAYFCNGLRCAIITMSEMCGTWYYIYRRMSLWSCIHRH